MFPHLQQRRYYTEDADYYEFCNPLIMLYGFLCSLDFALNEIWFSYLCWVEVDLLDHMFVEKL